MSDPIPYVQTAACQKWNQKWIFDSIADHVNGGATQEGFLAYPYSYLIRSLGSGIYDAIGSTGARVYGGPSDTGTVDGEDPTAVIQAALTGGGSIALYNLGTVTLNTPLDFGTGTRNLELKGFGTNTLDGEDLDDYALKLGNGTTNLGFVNLENFILKGGAELNKTQRIDMTHILFNTSGTDRFLLKYTDLNYTSCVDKCFFEHGDEGAVTVLGDSTDIQLINGLYYDNSNFDVYIYGTGAPYRRGLTIAANWFEHTEATEATPIHVAYADSTFIHDNHIVNFYGATSDGIVLTGGTFRSKIYSNWIKSATGRYGIYLDYASRNEVSSNYIAAADDDIYLSSNSGKNLVFANNVATTIDNDQTSSDPTVRNEVFRNFGYTTENHGEAQVANGEWVNHGLSGTPTDIEVSLRGGSARVVMIADRNSTQFQVFIYNIMTPGNETNAQYVQWSAYLR